MTVPKSVRVEEDDNYYSLVFDDDLNDATLVDTNPDNRVVTMAIGVKKTEVEVDGQKEIDISIAEVKFPKQLYSRSDVVDTASILEKAIKEEGCPPCVILSTTESVKKTHMLLNSLYLPTWKDLLPSE
jgi:hypothetical protein